MENVIELKLEDGNFKEDLINNNFAILIYKDSTIIGDIVGYATEELVHIETISFEPKYRRLRYGTIAINQLKEISKSLGINYIDGDCRGGLIKFYEKLGADFNPREEYNLTYINNRFYIDL